MQKPSLTKCTAEVKAYIEHLENRVAILDNNADVEMYVSLNDQLSRISKQISETQFNITNKNDVAIERFIDIILKSKTISENMNYFRSKLTPEEIKKHRESAAEAHIFGQ